MVHYLQIVIAPRHVYRYL